MNDCDKLLKFGGATDGVNRSVTCSPLFMTDITGA